MKKKVNIELIPIKEEHDNGCCATAAISCAFNINYVSMRTICRILGYDWTYGLSFLEIKKLLGHIDKDVEYHTNRAKLAYWQVVEVHRGERLLVMFSEHLSFCRNGVVFDSYLCDQKDREQWFMQIPTGWWRL